MDIVLSIVVPTYNREKVVQRALESVLSSSRKNIEVIVSDDGSKDNTLSLVKEIKDSRIAIIDNKVNNNANYARNRAIERAKGNLIAFLDSDDEFLPGRIDYILDFFSVNQDIDVLIDSFLVYKKKKQIENIDFKVGKITNDMLTSYLVTHAIPITFSTIVTKKDSIESIGLLDETFARHQDRDYLLTALENDQCFYIGNGKNVIKHQEEDSFSRSYKGYLKGLDSITCKHDIFLSKKFCSVFSYFISRVFIKSLITFNLNSIIYNITAFKDAKCLNGNVFLHMLQYFKGKRLRKMYKGMFKEGMYN